MPDTRTPDTRTQLLDLAEAEIRLRGYHAVSFRDLADALGIKSASVHYHFRQKEDLGLAVIARYRDRFFDALTAAVGPNQDWDHLLAAFQSVYRAALGGADRPCLCGVLGAESGGLPDGMTAAIAGFFQANIDWLAQAMPRDLDHTIRRARATTMVSALQGAMLLSVAMRDPGVFERTLDGFRA